LEKFSSIQFFEDVIFIIDMIKMIYIN